MRVLLLARHFTGLTRLSKKRFSGPPPQLLLLLLLLLLLQRYSVSASSASMYCGSHVQQRKSFGFTVTRQYNDAHGMGDSSWDPVCPGRTLDLSICLQAMLVSGQLNSIGNSRKQQFIKFSMQRRQRVETIHDTRTPLESTETSYFKSPPYTPKMLVGMPSCLSSSGKAVQ
jgi:hypothetical protein